MSVLIPEKTPSFLEQINTKEFMCMFSIWTVAVAIIIINIASNSALLDFQQARADGVSFLAFCVLFILWGIFGAIMVYDPYIQDRANGQNVILTATLLYLLAMIFWAFSLFHTEIGDGTSGVASILLLASNLWLAWACYHFNKVTVLIYIVQFIFSVYLINYTYSVGQLNWVSTPFSFGNFFQN